MRLNDEIFDKFPQLETARLTLREIELSDAQAIFDMRSNDRVNQFITRRSMKTLDQANDLALKTKNAFTEK